MSDASIAGLCYCAGAVGLLLMLAGALLPGKGD